MKIFFYTLGCKVNQVETSEFKTKLKLYDFKLSGDEKNADIYIVNSCSVTHIADRKTRQLARRGKKYNEKAKVIVIGCSVNIQKEKLNKIKGIDYMINNENKNDLIKLLLSLREKQDKSNFNKEIGTDSIPNEKKFTRKKAFIKIQDGCNKFCAYCIIPFTRGNPISYKEREIVKKAEEKLKKGYKEIVLTGINIALYKDEKTSSDLISLVSKIASLPYAFKITLSSLEPNVLDLNFLKKLLKIEKLNHKFHLSLQSGSNAILKKMGRNYTREEFTKIIKYLRIFDEKFFISTDIIVGFPCESEFDFLATYNLAKKAEFNHIHIFKYSKRPMTKAEKMKEQIPDDIKTMRARKLNSLNN
ncbi:MAG: tRNA (N(6)-L-threonylcarbamoyladenosine(37)-C(2))-methylthiotransferase MtaB [Clostridiales Family XIII bacterium]|jgi:threonylcarbamoyladenosine tRNA methylthiotransferase MtaB|nr:tRNA (N(6)-L-threonylcarbamoyladenosine(37)-C(2))-methylthiotransferase MtaB [Clostridiales Family XIII bacterium]